MATITMGVSGSGIVPDSSKTYTISDADLQAIMNWAKRFCPGIPDNPTNQQILLGWMRWMLTLTTNQVKQDQVNASVKGAADSVAPITIA